MRAVVLALTVALVACHQANLVPEFTAGKTTVFKYEGLLLGGLPQEGLRKAGVKVSCKVLIRAAAQNTFLLKLADPQLFEFTGVWPQDSFTPATKLTSALRAQLEIPIKFEYANGAVGKVFAPAGVSATVLNLHRGILNILHLNLKNTQNVYEMLEASPHGVCKTHYMITEDEKTHHISVTKSRDLNNCHERIIKDIGLAYAEKCEECQKRLQSLTGTATYSYTMKPTSTGAQVAEATVEELHQFSLFNTITGAAQMKAKQSLALLEVQDTPIAQTSGEYLARGSLKYEFGTEIFQTPIKLLKINNAEAQIADILQHLVTNNADVAHEDAPLKFVQLVQLMRVATFERLQAIWSQNKNKPAYRRWILDAAPVAGTPAALRFIKEKFLADEFTTSELAQALLLGLHMASADQDAIRHTASLALNPKTKTVPMLREVIMLGCGSMIAKYCVEDPSCPADLLRPIHEHVTQAIARAEIPEIILALKVLGNAGHPASLKPIMKLLPGFGSAAQTMPTRVHVDAILALRNIAKKEPKFVQPVALQLFMDKALHPEVRMTACIALFETKPSVALMSTIATAMEKEQNMQVASFAYSHIKSLTRSMAPDCLKVAAAANVAVRIFSPKLERLNYFFSTAYYMDLYLSPLMVGAAGSAFIINDAAAILPRAVVTKARAYLAGAAADVLEVGVRTDGLQEALRKAHAADEQSDRNTKLKRTMQALMNWKAMPTNQPLASIYVKVLGQEIAFANIDKTSIDNIIQDAAQVARHQTQNMLKETIRALQAGIAFQYAKAVMAAEIRRIVPTTVGMPLELGFYSAAVAAASVKVKAAITPALPENPGTATLGQLMRTDIQLQAEARPSVAMQNFAVIGVNTAIIQAAVMARGKIHIVVPGKMAARADLPNGSFKFEIRPAAVPDHVAAVSFETVAVARNIEALPAERVVSLAPAAPSGSKTLIPSSVQKSLCGVEPRVHVKGCVEVSSRNAGFMGYNPLYYIIGQHSARVSIRSDDGPALERLEFEVRYGPKAAEAIGKESRPSEVQSQEESTVLLKLRDIVESGLKNTSSSSSSSSQSSNSKSSRSSSSSRSSRRSRSSQGSKSSSSSASSISSSKSASSSASSSSSSSARLSKGSKAFYFKKFHNNEYLSSQETSNSSSASSIEVLQRKSRFLVDAVPPVFVIIARAVRSDRSLGYQVAAFLDEPTSRVQIVVSSVSQSDKWKLCADGVMASKHKVAAKLAWGEQCQEYSVAVKAETGLHESNPALRFNLEWDKLPRYLTLAVIYAKRTWEYLPLLPAARLAGFSVAKAENKMREIALIMAVPAERSMNIILRSPKMTVSKKAVRVPFAVTINRDGSIPALRNLENILEAIQDLDIYAYDQNMKINALIDKLLKYDEKLQRVNEKVQNEIEKLWEDIVQNSDLSTFLQFYDINTIIQNSDIRAIIEEWLNDYQA